MLVNYDLTDPLQIVQFWSIASKIACGLQAIIIKYDMIEHTKYLNVS